MSKELHALAKQFAMGERTADLFADEFIQKWKHERDAGMLLNDTDDISEQLSSIFCLADLYNPKEDRLDYELDESALRRKVSEVLRL